MISNVSRIILAFNLVQNTKKMLWKQQVKAEVLLDYCFNSIFIQSYFLDSLLAS